MAYLDKTLRCSFRTAALLHFRANTTVRIASARTRAPENVPLTNMMRACMPFEVLESDAETKVEPFSYKLPDIYMYKLL